MLLVFLFLTFSLSDSGRPKSTLDIWKLPMVLDTFTAQQLVWFGYDFSVDGLPYSGIDFSGVKKIAPKAIRILAKDQHLASIGVGVFEKLEELGPEVAEEISDLAGVLDHSAVDPELCFSGLRELTPLVAEKLSKAKYRLAFPSLHHLSASAAKALSKNTRGLTLGGHDCPLLFFDLSAASEVVQCEGDLVLYLSVVTPDIARVLASHGVHGSRLWLHGPYPKSLVVTPEALEILGTHGNLWINGLDKVPEEIRLAFDSYEGGVGIWTTNNSLVYSNQKEALSEYELMRELERLSPEAAKLLVRRTSRIILPRLVSIDPTSAAIISETPGILSLDGLSEVSADTARALAKHSGYLDLCGLKELPLSVAHELGSHRGLLLLGGVRSIDAEVGLCLSRHTGGLALGGVRTLSAESAEALGAAAGELSLDGLRTLPPDVAHGLARCSRRLSLGGLDELSPEAAVVLAGHRGHFLHLGGLKSISPETAKALAHYDGWLCLNGLAELSPEAALALSMHVGGLDLNGVKNISAEAAENLADHQGRICLYGL